MQKCSVFICEIRARLRHLQVSLFTSTRMSGSTSKRQITCGIVFVGHCRCPASQAPPTKCRGAPQVIMKTGSTPTNAQNSTLGSLQLPEGLLQIPNCVSCVLPPSYLQAKFKFLNLMPKVLIIQPGYIADDYYTRGPFHPGLWGAHI